MTLYTESLADQTDHFADVFVRENDAYGYDAVTTLWRSKVHSRRHFVKRNPVSEMDNLMFQQHFQCKFGWNKVKYARITITHVCFIAFTLAGSLGRCLNIRPIGLVFKQHPLDPASVNA